MQVHQLYENTDFRGVVYHGSNARFPEFKQDKARIVNDFWGGGVAYFTDSIPMAKNYAKGMAKRYGGTPLVYKVQIRLSKMFDVNSQFDGPEVTAFMGDMNADTFARGAGLMTMDADQYGIVASLKSGRLALSAEQVYKGLSNGGVNSAVARQRFIEMGFDGLRYNGEINSGAEHNVYLAYDAKDIEILSRHTFK